MFKQIVIVDPRQPLVDDVIWYGEYASVDNVLDFAPSGPFVCIMDIRGDRN